MVVTLRSAQPTDHAFLKDVYASTRADEHAAWSWDAPQFEAFLALQWNAQQHWYRTHVPCAEQHIVCFQAQSIGYIVVERGGQHLWLLDIALLAAYRNQGIGSLLIGQLLAEAAQACRSVRLHVQQGNPARQLYERLGFHVIAATGTHDLMERSPS